MIWPGFLTDHGRIDVSLKINKNDRGKGYCTLRENEVFESNME